MIPTLPKTLQVQILIKLQEKKDWKLLKLQIQQKSQKSFSRLLNQKSPLLKSQLQHSRLRLLLNLNHNNNLERKRVKNLSSLNPSNQNHRILYISQIQNLNSETSNFHQMKELTFTLMELDSYLIMQQLQN